jgi:HSP20 family protein
MDSWFDSFFGDDGGSLGCAWAGMPVALWDDEDHFFIEAELPGVMDNDVDVTVHNGMLFIRGERRPAEGRRYLYNGRSFGRFERVITLPEAVKTDDVQATLKDGILSITLPKNPEAKPRKITLQAG